MATKTPMDYQQAAQDTLDAWARFVDNVETATAKLLSGPGDRDVYFDASVELLEILIASAKGDIDKQGHDNRLVDPWTGRTFDDIEAQFSTREA